MARIVKGGNAAPTIEEEVNFGSKSLTLEFT